MRARSSERMESLCVKGTGEKSKLRFQLFVRLYARIMYETLIDKSFVKQMFVH